MTTVGDGLYQYGGMPVGANLMGVGNVYYVCYTTDTQGTTVYADMVQRFRGKKYKNDHSNILHTTIQSALDATVECRNDYVVVQPKNIDYDITAALTMSKKAVHMICPAGMGYDMGANNACRIEQTTDSFNVIQVSDAAVEIAGFYFKPDASASASIITLAANSYGLNIHHNYFTLKGSVAAGAGILASGTGGAWGQIVRNKFESQHSSATYGTVITIAANATGAEVSYNHFSIGNTSCVATVVIQNGAVLGNTNFNVFGTCGGNAVASGGEIGACINIAATGNAIGNRGAVGSAELLNGGTSAHSFCDNLDGRSTSGTDVWNLET